MRGLGNLSRLRRVRSVGSLSEPTEASRVRLPRASEGQSCLPRDKAERGDPITLTLDACASRPLPLRGRGVL